MVWRMAVPFPWARKRTRGAEQPIGVVLAGGLGRRIGGDKAVVAVERRPLVEYPLDALRAAGVAPLFVVAKRDTTLPDLRADVGRWTEPDTPHHPLTGIVHALQQAGNRPVVAVAADLALLDAGTIRTLLRALRPDDAAVVPLADGRLQPLCAVYAARARRPLSHHDATTRLTTAVEALGPRVVGFEDATPFFNVNAPEDVLRAGTLLRERQLSSSDPFRGGSRA